MGSLLDGWLHGAEVIAMRDEASLSEARQLARQRGASVGLDANAREELAAAVSELGRNQLRHAIGGTIGVRAVARRGVSGLEVIAADRGAGIADPATAFAGVPRTSGSLGVGLSAARRQAHEMDVDVRWGEGTCVRLRRFAAPVPRSEVAILCRSFPGESIAGDHAFVARDDGGTTVVVVDGLGHGPPARDGADAIVDGAVAAGALAPVPMLEQCNRATGRTRGGAMTAARLATPATSVEIAGIGNIMTRIVAPNGQAQIFHASPGVVGEWPAGRRIPTEVRPFDPYQLLVITTDGVATRVDLSTEPDLARQPLIAIAQRILATYGRTTDDALVLVAR